MLMQSKRSRMVSTYGNRPLLVSFVYQRSPLHWTRTSCTVTLLSLPLGVVAAAAAGLLLWWCRRRADRHKLPAAEDTLKASEMHYDYSLNSKQSG
jgi:uncharacterized iron-regulated membrane protein